MISDLQAAYQDCLSVPVQDQWAARVAAADANTAGAVGADGAVYHGASPVGRGVEALRQREHLQRHCAKRRRCAALI